MTEAQRIALDALITAMRRGQFPVGWTEHQIMAVGDIVRDIEDAALDARDDTELVDDIMERITENVPPAERALRAQRWVDEREADAETVEAVRTVLVDFGAITSDDTTTDVVQMLEILLPPADAS